MIDVRKNVEYDMCHLPFSVNIELSDFKIEKTLSKLIKQINSYNTTPSGK